MKLTDNREVIIQNFQKILTYGSLKLSLIPMDYTKVRYKKQVLYLIMGAVQSYSEAILKLLKPPNIYDKAAEVLLRSLVEAIINIDYIYADRSQIKALIFMIYSTEDQIDFGEKFRKLKIKHPTWKLDFGPIKSVAGWDIFLSKRRQEISFIEKKVNKKLQGRFPKLRQRAEQADSYLRKRGKLKEGNSLEKYYVLYYKYFSQLTHLTMPGLENFLSKDKRHYNLDGSEEDSIRVASVTSMIYFLVLRFFLKEYKTYVKSEFSDFEDLLKGTGKSI